MRKLTRREAILILLGGAASLSGCSTLSLGLKKPAIPEDCIWLEFPYGFACILPDQLKPIGDSSNPEQSGMSRKYRLRGFVPYVEKSPAL